MTIFNIGEMFDKCVKYVVLLQYLSKMKKKPLIPNIRVT